MIVSVRSLSAEWPPIRSGTIDGAIFINLALGMAHLISAGLPCAAGTFMAVEMISHDWRRLGRLLP